MQSLLSPSPAAKLPATIGALIDQTPDLPAMPSVALATYREAGRDGAIAASVGAIVASDAVLTARVLRLANSAYYGTAREITSLPDAVMRLGMKSVRNLCLIAGSYPWLNSGLPAYGLGHGALLTHSLALAIGAQSIADGIGKNPDAAFSAGLLHDLGKVALTSWISPVEGKVFQPEDERAAIGFDHGQAGGELARRWNLPPVLVAAVAGHHTPSEGLEDAVHLGNILGHLMEEGEPPVADAEALVRCGLTAEDLAQRVVTLKPVFERFKMLAEACA